VALEIRAANFRLGLQLVPVVFIPPLRLNPCTYIVMVHYMVLIHFEVAKTVLKVVRKRLTVCISAGAGLLLVW